MQKVVSNQLKLVLWCRLLHESGIVPRLDGALMETDDTPSF